MTSSSYDKYCYEYTYSSFIRILVSFLLGDFSSINESLFDVLLGVWSMRIEFKDVVLS